jgi:hypothetical protein
VGHRTVKRVALDFEWPKGKVWKGYVNPHFKKCPEDGKTCFNGENAAAKYLEHLSSMFNVAASSAHRGETHPYLKDLPYYGDHPDWEVQPPEVCKKMVDLVRALSGNKDNGVFAFFGSGHDIFFKLLDVAGIKNTHEENSPAYEWCHCSVCKGSGMDPAVKEKYDAWTETEPPEGKGWQLWETCSEGSPVSPVFETAEALADWCADNATIFASEKMSRSKWMELFKDTDALEVGSMMIVDTGTGYMGSAAQSPAHDPTKKDKANEA